jgi:hypothetical protein
MRRQTSLNYPAQLGASALRVSEQHTRLGGAALTSGGSLWPPRGSPWPLWAATSANKAKNSRKTTRYS